MSYPEEVHVLTSAPPNAKPANMDAAARRTLSNNGAVLWLVAVVVAAAAADDDGFDDTGTGIPSPGVFVRWRSDDRDRWIRSRLSSSS